MQKSLKNLLNNIHEILEYYDKNTMSWSYIPEYRKIQELTIKVYISDLSQIIKQLKVIKAKYLSKSVSKSIDITAINGSIYWAKSLIKIMECRINNKK